MTYNISRTNINVKIYYQLIRNYFIEKYLISSKTYAASAILRVFTILANLYLHATHSTNEKLNE